MKVDSLNSLCLHEVADLMSAEKQIAKAMPEVIKAATATGLQLALRKHLEQTTIHQDRLKEAATLLGNPSVKLKLCKGMEGLLLETSEFIEQAEGDAGVIDAGIIASCQRIELYEVAGYGTLCSFLELIGETKASTLLMKTLDEEKAASNEMLALISKVVHVEYELEPSGVTKSQNGPKREEEFKVHAKGRPDRK